MARCFTFLLLLLVLAAGCVSTQTVRKTTEPEITVSSTGIVTAFGRQVAPEKLAEAVEDEDLPKDSEIRILVEGDDPDRRLMRTISSQMVIAEHTRFLFVKPRKATSSLGKQVKFTPAIQPEKPADTPIAP